MLKNLSIAASNLGKKYEELTKVTSPDWRPSSTGQVGKAVAMSSDGSTLLISVQRDSDDSFAGKVYVFVRSGNIWLQQATLTTVNPQPSDFAAEGVAISGNGNTAIFSSRRGLYVYTRSGTTWNVQAILSLDVYFRNNRLSLSNDGNTAVIDLSGSIFVYSRSENIWTQQVLGVNLKQATISGDGNTILAVGLFDSIGGFPVYVYTKSGNAWNQQAVITNSLFRFSGLAQNNFVEISADGNTAVIDTGYVYTRSGSTWTQQAKLISHDFRSYDRFGHSKAVSSDGNIVLIGAPNEAEDPNATASSPSQGAVYVFTRSGRQWNQQAKLLASSRYVNEVGLKNEFGYALALSADGKIALISAPSLIDGFTIPSFIFSL